jgi:hypothetical protein
VTGGEPGRRSVEFDEEWLIRELGRAIESLEPALADYVREVRRYSGPLDSSSIDELVSLARSAGRHRDLIEVLVQVTRVEERMLALQRDFTEARRRVESLEQGDARFASKDDLNTLSLRMDKVNSRLPSDSKIFGVAITAIFAALAALAAWAQILDVFG